MNMKRVDCKDVGDSDGFIMIVEYKKILVCPNCKMVLNDDSELIYQHEENGINYSCPGCGNNTVIGLLVIGTEAVDDCLDILSTK